MDISSSYLLCCHCGFNVFIFTIAIAVVVVMVITIILIIAITQVVLVIIAQVRVWVGIWVRGGCKYYPSHCRGTGAGHGGTDAGCACLPLLCMVRHAAGNGGWWPVWIKIIQWAVVHMVNKTGRATQFPNVPTYWTPSSIRPIGNNSTFTLSTATKGSVTGIKLPSPV